MSHDLKLYMTTKRLTLSRVSQSIDIIISTAMCQQCDHHCIVISKSENLHKGPLI